VGQSGFGDEAPDATTPDETRDVVAQATGVLVAQFEIGPEAAFDKLTIEAADSGRPVSDVAREIVKNGGL
jgi:AmiR/NasT family two-component response regulator